MDQAAPLALMAAFVGWFGRVRCLGGHTALMRMDGGTILAAMSLSTKPQAAGNRVAKGMVRRSTEQ